MNTPARRLLMWDIDWTLVHTGGVAKLAYAEAFTKVTGVAWRQMPYPGGRTDRDIAAEAFALHGIADCTPHLETFFQVYADEFHARRHLLRDVGRVLPGVPQVLTALAARPHVVQTLVTGNIAPVALAKLTAFDLHAAVDFEIGGYGREDLVRADLVRRCRMLAERGHGRFADAEVVVIGDTVHDVAGALANGVTAIGVATGDTSAAELAAAGAHLVFDDLSEVDAVVDVLAGAAAP
ncbi:HAD hydrolase-like protein [Micromonospora sp. NPDC049679]|uniref:HAD hydrolase-like protein n=1 Tax=Micromonospora sp. NPDC049679 TaxID=3155920 RepID=UPI0033F1BCB6